MSRVPYDRVMSEPSEQQRTPDPFVHAVTPSPEHGVARRTGDRVRRVLAGFLVVASALSTVLTGLALWADHLLTDTDAYLAVVTPLAAEPAIQTAVSTRATEEILTALDLSPTASPDDATGLAQSAEAALVEALERQLESVISDVLASPAFATLWELANREAHERMAARIASGDDGTDGIVLVELGPIVAEARDALVRRGVPGAALIPDVERSIVLVESATLATVERSFRLLDSAAGWLPWLTLGLLASALVLAVRRRSAVIGFGISLALIAALALATLAWLPRGIESGSDDTGAGAVLADALLATPRSLTLACAVAGALIAVVALVTAPRRRGR